jgi:DNA-binding XRE family transcriptional regulator
MDYPAEFSTRAQAAVEAAKIRAAIDLSEEKHSTYYGYPTYEQLQRYVMAVVLVFGQEACELGRPNRTTSIENGLRAAHQPWNVSRIERETKEFLKRFAIEAYREKAVEGTKELLNESGEVFQHIWNGFLASPEWEDFEEHRLEIASIQAGLPFNSDDLPLRQVGRYRTQTAIEIERLRREAKLTQDQLAGLMECDPTTVYRHESGQATPQAWRISTYERVFSKLLKRDIVIPLTPIKRR